MQSRRLRLNFAIGARNDLSVIRYPFLVFVTLFVSAPLLTKCASTRVGLPPETSVIGEEFDPQTLDDDDFLIQPPDGMNEILEPLPEKETEEYSENSKENLKPTDQAEVSNTPAFKQVYRIQVAAVMTMGRAEQMKKKAERTFHLPAYIRHIPPHYKVQVGDFPTKREARRTLAETEAKGYQGAFMVSVWAAQRPSIPSHPDSSEPMDPVNARGAEDEVQGGHTVSAQGYRVQIFSTSDRRKSRRVYEAARNRLNREDIYLRFEPPFFRIRVGNCQTLDEAEELVRILEKAGFEALFPVRTQIRVPSGSPSQPD